MTRTLSAVFFVLFLLFAVVQLNDPDPYYWVVFYLLITTVALLQFLKRPNRYLIMVAMAIAIGTAVYYAPGFFEWMTKPEKSEIFGEMVYEKSYIEETREFLGSLIGLGALIYFYRQV